MKPTATTTNQSDSAAQPQGIWASIRRTFKDARDFQILYLGLFLLYGIFFLDWDAEISKYSVLIGTCLAVQAIGIQFTSKQFRHLKSALITALGLCLLLKSNSHLTLALAATVAIGSKFVIRFNKKHLFNPANIGIVIAILLTNDAWISPGQWGSETMLTYFFGAAAFIVLFRVGRIETSLAFLVMYFILEYSRTILYQGWPMDHLFHKFSNGALLLFCFFMITDPVTTPNTTKGRIIWASLVAIATFVLTSWFYVHTAAIWALFFITPITVLLDYMFKGTRFHWDDPIPKLKWNIFKKKTNISEGGGGFEPVAHYSPDETNS